MTDDQSSAAADLPGERPPPDVRTLGAAVLDQGEIDAVTGFRPVPPVSVGTGMRAMLDGGAVPRETLPALSVLFEQLAGRLTLSLRELFGADVEASLRSLRSVRYGALIDDVTLPTQLVVVRAEGLDGPGLVILGPDLARLVLDGLLGAGRDFAEARIAVRPFTAIETAILTRFAASVLVEASGAFAGVGLPVSLSVERVEADPRLAAVARNPDAAYLAELGLEVEGRNAAFQIVLPAAALEPVRARLRDRFAGRDAGRDTAWSGHLATAIWSASARAEAVLHETRLPLGRVMDLAIGDTLMFDRKPSDLVEIRCEGLPLARGRIGRVEGRIAVQVIEPSHHLTRPERPAA